jgi:hypothetical protein
VGRERQARRVRASRQPSRPQRRVERIPVWPQRAERIRAATACIESKSMEESKKRDDVGRECGRKGV